MGDCERRHTLSATTRTILQDDTMNSTAAAPEAPRGSLRYDRTTIFFHWLTAIIVITLFASAEIWENVLERGTPLRKSLQSLHISLGIALTLIIVLRLVWRIAKGRRLPPADRGAAEILSKAVHGLLYLLLIAQVGLGFAFRWAQGEPFSFFGLFDVPTLVPINHDYARAIGWTHDKVAWVIIILAAGHAIAALVHHYGMRDGVLRRMSPAGA